MAELRGMACICGDAVAEGLRSLEPGEPETKRAFRAAQRTLDLTHELTKRYACLPIAGICSQLLGKCCVPVLRS